MKLFGGEQVPTEKAKRLLIVDDEDSITELLGTYLSGKGYDVTVAESGEKALEKLSAEEFDLMTLDIELGDMHGMAVLDQAHLKHPQLPVIIVTGLGYDEELLNDAVKSRAAGFVSKTLPLSQLLMEVKRALK